jgi:alkaline phosphatase D
MRLLLGLLALNTALAAPPVLVIAIDGFRWDFAERENAVNLLKLKQEGASVEGLIPAFPSTTFPNFHTMATGLYPEHHNLVAMKFYDRAKSSAFSYMKNSGDGSWYGGKPIWLLAEDQGIKTATFFWPGTDAAIGGRNPSYFKRYDGRVPNAERVRQVLEWLRMPAAERPGLVVVYFSDVDSAGHRYGPDSKEAKDAIARVDGAVGELVKQLPQPINVVVLSDHGMSTVQANLDLSKRADFTGCIAANEAPMTMLYCTDPERVRAELQKNVPEVEVWRKSEVPAHLHYRDNARIGDLIITPKNTSIVQVLTAADPNETPVPDLKGMHGYDPRKYKEMRGILIGVGPAFRTGVKTPPAETVDVFVLLCKLLGVQPPAKLDADFSRVKPLLRERP